MNKFLSLKTINKLYKNSLLIVFFIFSLITFAQDFPSDFWHKGTIVLKNGDTLTGPLMYNLPENILLFKKENRQQSFTPNQVLTFSFVDVMDSSFRHFSTQELFIAQEYTFVMFFELLNVGQNILFTRERIQLSRQAAMASQGFAISNYELGFDYYYLPKDSIYLQPLRNTRKGLYDFFGVYKSQMKVFIKKNKIHYSYTHKKNMILIFKQLEFLKNKEDEQTIDFNYK